MMTTKVAITKILIKNIDVNVCRYCVHYIPEKNYKYDSYLSKCKLFGEKNVVTNKIRNDYTDYCRNDEEKCGLIGKYFEKEPNINFKITKHYVSLFFPFSKIISATSFIIYVSWFIRHR